MDTSAAATPAETPKEVFVKKVNDAADASTLRVYYAHNTYMALRKSLRAKESDAENKKHLLFSLTAKHHLRVLSYSRSPLLPRALVKETPHAIRIAGLAALIKRFNQVDAPHRRLDHTLQAVRDLEDDKKRAHVESYLTFYDNGKLVKKTEDLQAFVDQVLKDAGKERADLFLQAEVSSKTIALLLATACGLNQKARDDHNERASHLSDVTEFEEVEELSELTEVLDLTGEDDDEEEDPEDEYESNDCTLNTDQ